MPVAVDIPGLIKDLSDQIPYAQIANDLGMSESQLREWERDVADIRHQQNQEQTAHKLWKLIQTLMKERWASKQSISGAKNYGLFDILPRHGVPVPSYDISSEFNLVDPPIGFEFDPPVLPLLNRPGSIAGFPVDFPIGLPASVLAANSSWIRFYARRGFDILTYKTVRTEYRKEHPWPQWLFVSNPKLVTNPANTEVIAYKGYIPDDIHTLSMVNSFGVPSFTPDWWQDDIRRARTHVREGHQVLIVSVVSSKNDNLQTIANDFVEAATLAVAAGADIIEANYSCPNVQGDPAGELYRSPANAAFVSKALKEALASTNTPLIVKIGYLESQDLRQFAELNSQHIDGIVAINTISVKVVTPNGEQAFPDNCGVKRDRAGLSGWAIKPKAQEVARNLVAFRDEFYKTSGRQLTVLAVGGVVTVSDFYEYLDDIGVDGVESCTGAFLNPQIGLDTRLDKEAFKNRPSWMRFELEVIGKYLKDIAFNPNPSRIVADTRTRRVVVEPR